MHFITKYIFPKYSNNSNSVYIYDNIFKWNICENWMFIYILNQSSCDIISGIIHVTIDEESHSYLCDIHCIHDYNHDYNVFITNYIQNEHNRNHSILK